MADDIEDPHEFERHVRKEPEKPVSPEELARSTELAKRMMEIRAAIGRTEVAAKWLDSRYLDPIIGLYPGLGDAATALGSLYIVGEALNVGVPAAKIARMLLNIGIDAGVGSIPVLGDIFDFFYKANKRNVEIMRQHAQELERRAKNPNFPGNGNRGFFFF